MNKELFKRMLAKNERNRIKRKSWRKFLRMNPNYEENTKRSTTSEKHHNHPGENTFQKPVNQEKISMMNKIMSKFQSMFRRKTA